MDDGSYQHVGCVSNYVLGEVIDAISRTCVLQGAVATGAAEGHRGSDEEAPGKPKERRLRTKLSIDSF